MNGQSGKLSEAIWHGMFKEICISKNVPYREATLKEDRSGYDAVIKETRVDYTEDLSYKLERLEYSPYWIAEEGQYYWWKIGLKKERVLIWSPDHNLDQALRIQMASLVMRIKLGLI